MLPPSPPGSNHLVHNVLTFFHSQSSSIKVICNSIIPFAHTPPWIHKYLLTSQPLTPPNPPWNHLIHTCILSQSSSSSRSASVNFSSTKVICNGTLHFAHKPYWICKYLLNPQPPPTPSWNHLIHTYNLSFSSSSSRCASANLSSIKVICNGH